MIDLTAYEELKPGPRAVFDRLDERATRVRFMVHHVLADGTDDFHAVTWAAYAKAIRDTSAFLRGLGLSRGARIAIFAPNSVAWAVTAMAIQAAGHTMVPVYPASTASQLAYIVDHADADVLFVGGKDALSRAATVWDRLGRVQKVIVLDDLDPASVTCADGGPVPAEMIERTLSFTAATTRGAASPFSEAAAFDAQLREISIEDDALMLYTSGTTGNPKGVPLTHRNIAQNWVDWLRCFSTVLSEGTADLLWLPMSHIFGFGEIGIGNSLGFTSYLCEPHHALRLLPRVRPDVFLSVPAYWEKLAQGAMVEPDAASQRKKLAELTGGRFSFCLSGGAGLKREVKELFYAHGILVLEGYGLSECSPTLTLNRPNAFRFDSVGKPLATIDVRLAEDGEILARGPNIFRGYHKDEAATREAFTDDGWFKTGDIGRFTEDGFLQIVDRKKEILVTAGGKNVPPANIEMRFADDPLFSHVLVYGDGKKYLVMAAWLDAENAAARAEKEGVAGRDRKAAQHEWVRRAVDRVNLDLAKFEQIKKFVVIETPLTVAGNLLTSTLKVRRKKIYETFKDDFEALYASGDAT